MKFDPIRLLAHAVCTPSLRNYMQHHNMVTIRNLQLVVRHAKDIATHEHLRMLHEKRWHHRALPGAFGQWTVAAEFVLIRFAWQALSFIQECAELGRHLPCYLLQANNIRSGVRICRISMILPICTTMIPAKLHEEAISNVHVEKEFADRHVRHVM